MRSTRTIHVEGRDCATQWGNDGLEVLSTPSIIGHMERICVEALGDWLGDGDMTVGTAVKMDHAAAAMLGEAVTFEIAATEEGRRIEVDFEVTRADGTRVSSGHHTRARVNSRRFLEGLAGAKVDVRH